ncbi:unnamed protein product, partial [Meganyctiphanes norvegica]
VWSTRRGGIEKGGVRGARGEFKTRRRYQREKHVAFNKKMVSVTSQLVQLGDLPNFKRKSTSSEILCAVCDDELSSVLSYHEHNVTKHTSHELSLAIIKVCGLKDYLKNNLLNRNGKDYGKDGKPKEQLECNLKVDEEPQNKKEDITCSSFINQNQKDKKISNNNGKGAAEETKDSQNINEKYPNKNETYQVNDKDINRVRIKKRKTISKNLNEDYDLYECIEVVPSKAIKLEEEILREINDNETTNNEERSPDLSTNFGVNLCDYLGAEEVFLQPHNYTEETIPHMSHSVHSAAHPFIQENYFQVHSNNTFSEYEHPKIFQQSENKLVDDQIPIIPISGPKIKEKADVYLATYSPITEACSTSDISLASLIYLVLQNSVEGLPISIIYTLLQSLFPYFLQKTNFFYASSDWHNSIKKTLRKEKGFTKIKRTEMASNDTVWGTTSIISKYEKEIQNSSQIEDFAQSPELLKALKRGEVKFDTNGNNISLMHPQLFVFNSSSNSQPKDLLCHQKKNVEEGMTNFKQGFNNQSEHTENPLEGTFNQESFNSKTHSRSNEMENVLTNNNKSVLLNDIIQTRSDLTGMFQNISPKNSIANACNVSVLRPERKKYKCEENYMENEFLKDSQIDLLVKKNSDYDLENSDGWKIDYIEVKNEPFSWCEEDNHQNLIYKDVECNNSLYDEKIYDFNTESSNFSSESNESTFENETNFVLDNNEERDVSGNILLQNILHGINYDLAEETLQQSVQQIIPSKEKDNSKAKKSFKIGIDDNVDVKKKLRKRKKSPIKSNDWLPRNRTKHRMNEKMRRMELNQQFDNLMKKLPEYGDGVSLPKNEILNSARKFVSKLENVTDNILKK